MTKIDKLCDGKNCDHEFAEGEDYIQIADGDPYEIFCTRECAMTKMSDPFTYGYIGDDEKV